jgi:hypothetical protein
MLLLQRVGQLFQPRGVSDGFMEVAVGLFENDMSPHIVAQLAQRRSQIAARRPSLPNRAAEVRHNIVKMLVLLVEFVRIVDPRFF